MRRKYLRGGQNHSDLKTVYCTDLAYVAAQIRVDNLLMGLCWVQFPTSPRQTASASHKPVIQVAFWTSQSLDYFDHWEGSCYSSEEKR